MEGGIGGNMDGGTRAVGLNERMVEIGLAGKAIQYGKYTIVGGPADLKLYAQDQ